MKDLHLTLRKIETLLQSQTLNNKTVLTVPELTIYSGISKQYIYKLTSSNQIPYYAANGKNIYFKRSEIDDWLLRNRRATEEELKKEDYRSSKK